MELILETVWVGSRGSCAFKSAAPPGYSKFANSHQRWGARKEGMKEEGIWRVKRNYDI